MSPSTPGDAACSATVPVPEPEPKPLLDGEQGHGRGQAFHPASAPSRISVSLSPDDGGVPLVAGIKAKTSGVLSSPTTPVPSIIQENQVAPVQNDKSSWTPASVTAAAVPVRPKGPSLLTQQLAEARGILPLATGQSLDSSHSGLCPQHSSCDPAIAFVPKHAASSTQEDDTKPHDTNDDPERRDDSDDSSLTPRASPRSVPMATTAVISTLSLSHRVTDTIQSRAVGSSQTTNEEQRPRPHMDLVGSKGRTFSSERTDRDRKPKDLSTINRTSSNTSALSHDVGTMSTKQDSLQAYHPFDNPSATDIPSPARPRKPDQRLSMGPEKVWSIGSDDLNNDQDGQVEKSIAEVLAGVEPNARSRKASHSLRFFKEGLPEEKLKRRDSRLAPREKFLATDDAVLDRQRGGLHGGDQLRSLQPSPGQTEEIPGRFTRTRTFPLQSTESQHHDAEAPDYFQLHSGDRGHATPQTPSEQESVVAEKQPATGYPTIEEDEEPHEGGSEVAVEDAELSGEEKISSAVFVPHKAPQGVPESPAEDEEVFDAPVKPSQRKNGDGASWLVKADEPEADEPGPSDINEEDQAHDASNQMHGAGHFANGVERSNQPSSLPVINIDNQQGVVNPPQPASSGYEEQAQDPQPAPEQPRDAIELIPYRHQVGGHTTLWRFSKRAVCKQLNNRENEFYEKIERYHRDLLPFLPRYVSNDASMQKVPVLFLADADPKLGTLVSSTLPFQSSLVGNRQLKEMPLPDPSVRNSNRRIKSSRKLMALPPKKQVWKGLRILNEGLRTPG